MWPIFFFIFCDFQIFWWKCCFTFENRGCSFLTLISPQARFLKGSTLSQNLFMAKIKWKQFSQTSPVILGSSLKGTNSSRPLLINLKFPSYFTSWFSSMNIVSPKVNTYTFITSYNLLNHALFSFKGASIVYAVAQAELFPEPSALKNWRLVGKLAESHHNVFSFCLNC